MFYESVTSALINYDSSHFQDSSLLRCVTGQVHGLLDPDDEGITVPQIIWNSTPSNTVLCPRIPESSATSM